MHIVCRLSSNNKKVITDAIFRPNAAPSDESLSIHFMPGYSVETTSSTKPEVLKAVALSQYALSSEDERATGNMHG